MRENFAHHHLIEAGKNLDVTSHEIFKFGRERYKPDKGELETISNLLIILAIFRASTEKTHLSNGKA